MMPFINLGLVPEFASSQLLQKRTGYLKAVEMLMLGEKFNAEIALDYRLINQICEENELIAVALNTAKKLSKTFSKVCETLCKENKSILENLDNIEPKNDS